MLAVDLERAAAGRGHDVVSLARHDLDITDAAAARAAVAHHAPGVVVNCAAYTDVDGAEAERAWALKVNGEGAGNLARAASAAGSWILHVSSDYVFDGTKLHPYLESDPVAPRSAYGESKLAGERAVAEGAPDGHTIVRSSWLFGRHGACFPATILRLAAERPELTVVEDQIGCPTYTGHLADGLVELAERAGEPSGEPPVRGIVHAAAAGACSWYEFARAIVEHADAACEVRPGTTEELGRPAPRPAYSVLGTERPGEAPRLPGWREGLTVYLQPEVAAR